MYLRVVLLPTHMSSFARKDHMNQLIEVQAHEISSLDIHQYLADHHPDLVSQLLPHATLSNIVHIARSNPQGFTAYCTISNTPQLVIRLSSGTVPHPIGSPGQPFSSSPLALTPLLPNRATIRYLLLPIPSPSDYPSRRHPPQTKIIRLHLFLGLAAWRRHM